MAIATTPIMGLGDWKKIADDEKPTAKAPVLFIGHGSPMNALMDTAFTQRLAKLGQTLEKPKAILVVSAHWLTRGTWVATSPNPETIYDFGGFPKELSQVVYAAPGAPEIAKETATLLKDKAAVQHDNEMGLDHGAWTVLKHIYPKADIPVFQLSIDFYQTPQYHYDLAKYLSSLREKGVMIIGSGNIVHNLRQIDWKNPSGGFDWAAEFDETVKKYVNEKNHQGLIDYSKLGTAAAQSIPTNDHYLPLLYTLALQGEKEQAQHIYEGLEYGSISMRCIQFG